MLSQLQHLNINLGKYRDDALGVTSMTPRQADIAKKEICKIYQQNSLSIEIQVNAKSVDFLDINLDLRTGIYKPFMKPRCMPNMSQNLAKHNAKVSMNQEQDPPAACNCRGGPMVCPLGGACQTRSVVYQAAVLREDNNTTETYTGLTSRRFKDRYYEHRQDMTSRNRKGTSLSNYIWKLKSISTPFKIT